MRVRARCPTTYRSVRLFYHSDQLLAAVFDYSVMATDYIAVVINYSATMFNYSDLMIN